MKSLIKLLFNGIALPVVLPCYLGFLLSSLVIGRRRAFPGWSQAFALAPGFIGIYLRRAFYQMVFPRCGKDVCLSFGVIFSHPTMKIGRSVYVGPYGSIGDATLEDDVLIGSHV